VRLWPPRPVFSSLATLTSSCARHRFIGPTKSTRKEPTDAYWPGAPDFLVEILFPQRQDRRSGPENSDLARRGRQTLRPSIPNANGDRLSSTTDIAVKSGADVLGRRGRGPGFAAMSRTSSASLG